MLSKPEKVADILLDFRMMGGETQIAGVLFPGVTESKKGGKGGMCIAKSKEMDGEKERAGGKG